MTVQTTDLSGPAPMFHRMMVIAVLASTGVTAACSDGTAPEPPGRLVIADGDGQTGAVNRRLPRPMQVLARGEDGAPLAGVRVRWHAELNGAVDRATSLTGADGRATAWFTLGPAEGTAAATARIASDSAPFIFEARADSPEELPYGEIRLLELPTFDGSGQTVHPDHVQHEAAGFAFPRHLAITPYPFGNARRELPSVFAGSGAAEWGLEEGAPNPVVAEPASGHMSDPDIVFVPEAGELWMYYRHVTSRNTIWLVRTRNGRTWTAPVEVLAAPNHGIISPAVVRRAAGDWWMWYIDGGAGCSAATATVRVRRSADGIRWGPATALAMSHDGMHPWHIEVQWLADRGEFWALYNSKTPGGCTTPAVFLATSSDGMAWTHQPVPVLAKGAHPDLADIVYRGTFLYDHERGDVTFWHSGATYRNGGYVWRSAVQRLRVDDLLARDAGPPIAFTPAPAALVHWP